MPRHRPASASAPRRHAGSSWHGSWKQKPAQAANQNKPVAGLRAQPKLDVAQINLRFQNVELQDARKSLVGLDQYHNLFDSAQVGYFAVDGSGVILEANLTGAALLGVERAGIIKRRLQQFISPASQQAFLEFLKKAFSSPAILACDVLLLKGCGAFWAGFSTLPINSFKGARKCCQFAFGDISAHKQAARLSSRELEVLTRIADGKANKQIAAELHIAARTVEKHRGHLMAKLDIHETAGLTRFAIASGVTNSGVRLHI